MNITQEFREIFSGEQAANEEEQDVLLDVLLFMRDDVENQMPKDVILTWKLKLTGVIEYLEATGKINAEQLERLIRIVKEIEGVDYE